MKINNVPKNIYELSPKFYAKYKHSAQQNLLSYLKLSAEKNKRISMDDILDFYIENIKKTEYYIGLGAKFSIQGKELIELPEYKRQRVKKWRDDPFIKQHAYGWFTHNIGSLVLKGKLIAIPLFDFNEEV